MRKLINWIFHKDDGQLTAWVEVLISSIDASVPIPEPDYQPGPNAIRRQPSKLLGELKELHKMVAGLRQGYERLERASKPVELIDVIEEVES